MTKTSQSPRTLYNPPPLGNCPHTHYSSILMYLIYVRY